MNLEVPLACFLLKSLKSHDKVLSLCPRTINLSDMKRKVLSLSLFLMLFFGTFWLQAQEYVQQTDLPTIYIETEGGRPIVSKEDYVDAVLHYVDSNGVKTYDALGVRGRGNSTWN